MLLRCHSLGGAGTYCVVDVAALVVASVLVVVVVEEAVDVSVGGVSSVVDA
jgi:hypothetical protein